MSIENKIVENIKFINNMDMSTMVDYDAKTLFRVIDDEVFNYTNTKINVEFSGTFQNNEIKNIKIDGTVHVIIPFTNGAMIQLYDIENDKFILYENDVKLVNCSLKLTLIASGFYDINFYTTFVQLDGDTTTMFIELKRLVSKNYFSKPAITFMNAELFWKFGLLDIYDLRETKDLYNFVTVYGFCNDEKNYNGIDQFDSEKIMSVLVFPRLSLTRI